MSSDLRPAAEPPSVRRRSARHRSRDRVLVVSPRAPWIAALVLVATAAAGFGAGVRWSRTRTSPAPDASAAGATSGAEARPAADRREATPGEPAAPARGVAAPASTGLSLEGPARDDEAREGDPEFRARALHAAAPDAPTAMNAPGELEATEDRVAPPLEGVDGAARPAAVDEARESGADGSPAEDSAAGPPGAPSDAPTEGRWGIQIGAFPSRPEAESRRRAWAQRGLPSFVMPVDLPGRGRWYRVRVGEFEDRDAAEAAARRVRRRLGKAPLVVRYP